jgi:hypothetical protein
VSIIPVRDLGALGVITDRQPYDIALNAFSAARNVIFDDGKVMRAPVFKKAVTSITPATTHLMYTVRRPGVADRVLVVQRDGAIYSYSGLTETDITAAAFVPAASDEPVTATTLQNVVYINRPTDIPYSWVTTAADFVALSPWTANWRCRALRSYKECLIALNMTEGATEYGKRVRWSDFAQYGAVPGSWTPSASNNAGVNDLADLEMPIVDGAPLRDQFVIYSAKEAYLMTFIGGKLVFAFRKLWDNVGVINTNCVVEVDGQHVVFCQDDIVLHNLGSKKSIADTRVKDRIFSALNYNKAHRCFVHHLPERKEVWFCYPSTHSECYFQAPDYCNEAAVWKYTNDTWSFLDIPNLGSGTNVALTQSGHTWAASSGTWDADVGAWSDIESNVRRVAIFGGATQSSLGLTTKQLLVADNLNFDARTPYEVYTTALCDAYAFNSQADLDQLGLGLSTYKVLRVVYPQAVTAGASGEFGFRFGGAMAPAAQPTLGAFRSFDPSTEHKIDVRGGGRYGSWKIQASGMKDFWCSGFDLDVVQTGMR